MPYPPLRIIVGLLCAFFAYCLGRAAVRLKEGHTRQSTLISWTLRTAVAATAVLWHAGLDWISIGMILLSALACAAGVYLEIRPKYREELEKVMFPRD